LLPPAAASTPIAPRCPVGIGGTGDFRGSFVASIALGLIGTAGKYFIPAASSYVFFATVIILLLWRPRGLIPGPAQ
jgi:branched-chain amino acid transport system permease protein